MPRQRAQMRLCGDSTEGLKQRHLEAGAPGGTRGRGPNKLLPGGHLRLVEADGRTPRAAPSAIGVPGQEAVPTLECEAAYSNPCKRHVAWEAGPGSHSYTRLQCPTKPPPGSRFSCKCPSPHIPTAHARSLDLSTWLGQEGGAPQAHCLDSLLYLPCRRPVAGSARAALPGRPGAFR